jgi:N-acetylmuramic acid 6-phosphate (MurNAc-6-P) etherase
MKLANIKLLERAARMVIESTGCTAAQARAALEAHGSVRTAISNLNFS